MKSSTNGHGAWHEPRRFRFDERRGGVGGVLGRRHSGRWVVLGGAIVIALVSILLYLSFQSWKARYRALAEFGRSEVAPVVDPLTEIEPPGVALEDWRRAVADTHTLLVVLTTSGLLDRAAMEALRDELRGRVAAAGPATAIDTLRGIWDDLVKRAGPTLTVKPSRPPFPPERPAILIKPADPVPR